MGKRQEAALETKRKIIEVVKEMLKEKKLKISILKISRIRLILRREAFIHILSAKKM